MLTKLLNEVKEKTISNFTSAIIDTRYSYQDLQMEWLNNYVNQEPLKWLDEKKCFTNRN